MKRFFSTLLQLTVLVGLSYGIYTLAISGLTDNTNSDPKLNLLVSQAVVEHNTLALTLYRDDEILGRTFQWFVNIGDIIENDAGEFYHYFPVGPSMLSVPFVLYAQQQGMDMRTDDNRELQRILAAGSLVVVLWVLVGIGRIYTNFLASTTIAVISIIGSTIISSLGTALWSLNFSIILLGLALLMVARHSEHPLTTDAAKWRKVLSNSAPILLGLLLFLAFFCRASAAALIAPLLIYLIWKDRRYGIAASLTSGLLLLGFLYWSNATFGNWLPDYYSTGRLTVERQPMWVGIIGNLVSPSRGVFVFSPFFALVPIGLIIFWRRLQPKAWLLVLLAWFGLHLLLVARAAKWWGGWSYGPRVLSDASLALIVLTFMLWRAVQQRTQTQAHTHLRRASIALLFLVLGAGGVAINSYQGLFNQAVMRWYTYISPIPAIHTRNPLGDMFRWDYAQFLATDKMVCDIDFDKSKTFLDAPLPLGELPYGTWMGFRNDEILDREIVFNYVEHEPKPFFVGWSFAEAEWRWSACPEARIIFELPELKSDAKFYNLGIKVYALVPQPVTVIFNNRELLSSEWDYTTPHLGEIHITISHRDLKPLERNELKFVFPEVKRPSETDQRLLGIGFAGLEIEPIEGGE